ncbi:MAG: 1-(5-phosphoribosyl)-5-[(5-phosphoribosylamino)methylideneamino] imidazole-4-carboxamide isomerase [Candidatus Caldarchaeum sp.]
MFTVYAGIDLFNGRVARLWKGDPAKATYYPYGPSHYARRWLSEGADALHVVDLNAALELGDNTEVITSFVKSLNAFVQVGGGVRSLARATALRDAGASRIIVSSLYFTRREEALKVLDILGAEHLALSLDCREDFVVVRGWSVKTETRLAEAVDAALSDGFRHIVLTDTSRDGTLQGVNSKLVHAVEKSHRSHITYAGGVSSVDDVLTLRRLGYEGAILGKALYEETLSLERVRNALEPTLH